MDKRKAAEKIAKLLALANSDNEHEAAAARRQAESMMRMYGIDEDMVEATGATKHSFDTGSVKSPDPWQSILANVVGRAFHCRTYVTTYGFQPASVEFVGVGPKAEIAAYTYEVLLQQARNARRAYMSGLRRNTKPANKRKKADIFCEAWVSSVADMVRNFAGAGEKESRAIDAWISEHVPNLRSKDLKMADDKWGNRLHGADDARQAGRASGKRARLNHGVGNDGKGQRALGRA